MFEICEFGFMNKFGGNAITWRCKWGYKTINSVNTVLTFLTFLLWHNLHVFKNKKRKLRVCTSLRKMPFSAIIYLDRETTVISIFIYAKEIANVKPLILHQNVLKFDIFSVNAPLNYNDDMKY